MIKTLQAINQNKLVAVIRGAREEEVLSVARALSGGGVNILEITAETPGVVKLIERVRADLGDRVTVGAGTVLDPETARAAIMAGAQFIFSPIVNVETIRITKRCGIVSIPGAMTPTEILTAYENGADIIKVFPANIMGPGYLKDIHGPLPHIPLMPTGGVNMDNILDYLRSGAMAAGLGSSLVNAKRPIDETELEQIKERAQQFRSLIDKEFSN